MAGEYSINRGNNMGNEFNARSIYSDLRKTYYIPESFERWTEYRNRITDYIIKYTEAGKTLAIIGVGDSNDIDLAKLYDHVGNLALYDIDMESVERALNKYNLVGKPNISAKKCDLFGATTEEYIDLINICLKDVKKVIKSGMKWSPYISSDKYLKKMEEIFDRANGSELSISDDKYDYTVMIGVHSQVLAFVERIWLLFLEAYKKEDSKISNKVAEESEILMPKINDALLEITKERAFLGCEMKEFERDIMVQGAKQCLLDIQKRIDEGELKSETSYQDVWPFREGLSYYMYIYRIEKP